MLHSDKARFRFMSAGRSECASLVVNMLASYGGSKGVKNGNASATIGEHDMFKLSSVINRILKHG